MPSDYLFAFDLEVRDTWLPSDKWLRYIKRLYNTKSYNMIEFISYLNTDIVELKIKKGNSIVFSHFISSFDLFMNSIFYDFRKILSLEKLYIYDAGFIIYSDTKNVMFYIIEDDISHIYSEKEIEFTSEEEYIITSIIDINKNDFERNTHILKKYELSVYQFIRGILEIGRDYRNLLQTLHDTIARVPANAHFEPYQEGMRDTYAFFDIFQAQEPAMIQWLQSKNPHDTLEED